MQGQRMARRLRSFVQQSRATYDASSSTPKLFIFRTWLTSFWFRYTLNGGNKHIVIEDHSVRHDLLPSVSLKPGWSSRNQRSRGYADAKKGFLLREWRFLFDLWHWQSRPRFTVKMLVGFLSVHYGILYASKWWRWHDFFIMKFTPASGEVVIACVHQNESILILHQPSTCIREVYFYVGAIYQLMNITYVLTLQNIDGILQPRKGSQNMILKLR